MARKKKTTLKELEKLCNNFDKALEKEISFGNYDPATGKLDLHPEVQKIVSQLHSFGKQLEQKEALAERNLNADFGSKVRKMLDNSGAELSEAQVLNMIQNSLNRHSDVQNNAQNPAPQSVQNGNVD